jgi:hypothetical protein
LKYPAQALILPCGGAPPTTPAVVPDLRKQAVRMVTDIAISSALFRLRTQPRRPAVWAKMGRCASSVFRG